MVEGLAVIRRFETEGVRLFVGVPDSLMKGFCNALSSHQGMSRHVVAANEGAAVATAAGHYLATGRPAVVYMQNSGLGNAVNPLSSLTSRRVYGIPMVLLIGWRGEPGVDDEPQHEHQGAITPDQLQLLDIPVTIVGAEDEVTLFEEAYQQAASSGRPIALLVRKGTFTSTDDPVRVPGLTRFETMATVLDGLPPDTAYVATTGFTGRELALLRDQRGETGSSDLLMVGSMGHASALALGLAIGSPDRLVCCLDGDGAVAMHTGTLAAIGAERPSNLVHVVFNNRVHESVGGQPSALRDVELDELARSLGYRQAAVVSTEDELVEILRGIVDDRVGPVLLDVRVGTGTVDGLPRPSEFHRRMADMMEWLDDG